MYILGVDCAWTQKEPSGVALVELNNDKVQLIKLGRSYQEFCLPEIVWDKPVSGVVPDFDSLLEYNWQNGWDVHLIALDIPLSSSLITGRRSCDDEVSKQYGAKWAGVHSPTPERPGQISLAIYEQLTHNGYKLNGNSDQKAFIEVYPHASIIELFGLDKRLEYKVQKINKFWPDLSREDRYAKLIFNLNKLKERLGEHIFGVREKLPVLKPDQMYSARFLKGYEDCLDALVCAITGIRYIQGRVQGYGMTEEKIWVVS